MSIDLDAPGLYRAAAGFTCFAWGGVIAGCVLLSYNWHRRLARHLILLGFVGLAVTTALVAIAVYRLRTRPDPDPPTPDPVPVVVRTRQVPPYPVGGGFRPARVPVVPVIPTRGASYPPRQQVVVAPVNRSMFLIGPAKPGACFGTGCRPARTSAILTRR